MAQRREEGAGLSKPCRAQLGQEAGGPGDAVVTNDWVWAAEAESWGHFKEVGWVGGAGKHQGPGPLCGAEGGCQSSEWGQGRAGVSGSEIQGQWA